MMVCLKYGPEELTSLTTAAVLSTWSWPHLSLLTKHEWPYLEKSVTDGPRIFKQCLIDHYSRSMNAWSKLFSQSECLKPDRNENYLDTIIFSVRKDESICQRWVGFILTYNIIIANVDTDIDIFCFRTLTLRRVLPSMRKI